MARAWWWRLCGRIIEPTRADLAKRGYVVLAPAYPLMSDYQPDLKGLRYQKGPGA